MIEYKLNPIVRCCGFLYIRYCCDPEYMWSWLRRYLLDEEEVTVTIDMHVLTVGEFVEKLLMEQEYYNTRFPRIPIRIENKLKTKLLITQEKRDRRRRNFEIIHKFVKKAFVRAISREDEEWHKGYIEKAEGKMIYVKFFPDDNIPANQ